MDAITQRKMFEGAVKHAKQFAKDKQTLQLYINKEYQKILQKHCYIGGTGLLGSLLLLSVSIANEFPFLSATSCLGAVAFSAYAIKGYATSENIKKEGSKIQDKGGESYLNKQYKFAKQYERYCSNDQCGIAKINQILSGEDYTK